MNIVVNYNKNATSLFVGLINYTSAMTNSTATNLYLVSAFTSANCDLFNVVYVNNNCASINLSGVIYVSTSNGYLYLLMSINDATYFTYYQSIDIQRIS